MRKPSFLLAAMLSLALPTVSTGDARTVLQRNPSTPVGASWSDHWLSGRARPARRATKRGAVHYRDGLNRKQQASSVVTHVTELRARRPGRAVLPCTVHEPKRVRVHSFGRPHRTAARS